MAGDEVVGGAATAALVFSPCANCMYVCMCVCIYVCIDAYFICMYRSIVCMYICMYRMSVCMHCTYALYVCMYCMNEYFSVLLLSSNSKPCNDEVGNKQTNKGIHK